MWVDVGTDKANWACISFGPVANFFPQAPVLVYQPMISWGNFACIRRADVLSFI